MSFSASDFCSSVLPAGNLLTLKMNARISAFCRTPTSPGSPLGMVRRILSNSLPTVRPFQLSRKSWPASGGASSCPGELFAVTGGAFAIVKRFPAFCLLGGIDAIPDRTRLSRLLALLRQRGAKQAGRYQCDH